MSDTANNIGEFRFGLNSAEAHAEFVDSLYRDLEPLRKWGNIPEGTSYHDVADAILDTISNYAGIAPITATELSVLISDALVQV